MRRWLRLASMLTLLALLPGGRLSTPPTHRGKVSVSAFAYTTCASLFTKLPAGII